MNESKPNDLNSEELQRIRELAIGYAKTPGTNSLWKMAYMRFAEAVDYIDAMIARSTIENKGR